MRKFFFLALPIFIFHSGLAGTTNAQTYDAEIHQTLLRYAMLAGIAYKVPETYCLDPLNVYPVNASEPNNCPYEIVTVSNLPIAEYIRGLDRYDIEVLEDTSTGEEFIDCSSRMNLSLRITMAINYVWGNDEISILPKINVVLTQALANILTENEELRVVELQQEGSENSVLGVQGTDFLRIGQINTSIQELIGNSCAFDIAVDVVNHFFDPCENDSNANVYSIVGHSLGGAVAQYVAHNLASRIDECRNTVDFQAYSFNSIGMDSSAVRGSSHRNINSVRIAGEVLEQIGGNLNRKQLGHIFRYREQLNQSSPNQSLMEKFRLHEIRTVKEMISHCISYNGSFEYTRPGKNTPTLMNC